MEQDKDKETANDNAQATHTVAELAEALGIDEDEFLQRLAGIFSRRKPEATP